MSGSFGFIYASVWLLGFITAAQCVRYAAMGEKVNRYDLTKQRHIKIISIITLCTHKEEIHQFPSGVRGNCQFQ